MPQALQCGQQSPELGNTDGVEKKKEAEQQGGGGGKRMCEIQHISLHTLFPGACVCVFT